MLNALLLASALAASPTPAELTSFGRDVEAQFQAGEDGLAGRISLDAMLERTLAGLDMPRGFKEGFGKGFKKVGDSFGASLKEAVAKGGRVHFRKPVTVAGLPGVQLRLLTADGSFNVLELVLARDASGALRVVDLFDLVSGELKSEEIRRMAIMGLAETRQGFLDKLTGKDQVFLESLPRVKALSAAVREGRAKDAVTEWNALPQALKDQRTMMRLYVTAAFQVDEKLYEKALGRYLALFPNDASTAVMAIDFYYLKKRWDRFGWAVDTVEKRIGTEDAWMQVLRSNALEEQGRHAEALAALRVGVEREKALTDPYFMLIGYGLKDKAWPEVTKWLTALERDAKVPLSDVSTVPEYAAYAASKEGKIFVKGQRARAGAAAR